MSTDSQTCSEHSPKVCTPTDGSDIALSFEEAGRPAHVGELERPRILNPSMWDFVAEHRRPRSVTRLH